MKIPVSAGNHHYPLGWRGKHKVIIQSPMPECCCSQFCYWNYWLSNFQQANSHTPKSKGILEPKWTTCSGLLKLLVLSMPWLESTIQLWLLHCLEPESVRLCDWDFWTSPAWSASLTGPNLKLGWNRFLEITTTGTNSNSVH